MSSTAVGVWKMSAAAWELIRCSGIVVLLAMFTIMFVKFRHADCIADWGTSSVLNTLRVNDPVINSALIRDCRGRNLNAMLTEHEM